MWELDQSPYEDEFEFLMQLFFKNKKTSKKCAKIIDSFIKVKLFLTKLSYRSGNLRKKLWCLKFSKKNQQNYLKNYN